MKKQRGITGFTLVELLIYSAIFTVTAGLLTSILIMVSNIQTKENASFEVTRQLQFITQTVQYAIRDSSIVDAVYEGSNPANPCTQYCTVRLRVTDPALDPTIVSSDAGGVYIQEGANPKVPLTSTKVRISNLKFVKTDNPGGISTTTIDLAIVYDGGSPELTFTKALSSAIAHVSAATFDSDLLPDTDAGRGVGSSTLRWRDLTLSNGLTISGPAGAGEYAGITMKRGTTHGSSSLTQYYTTGTPDKYGTHLDVGGTPMLYLEADSSAGTRRSYLLNSNLGIGTATPTSAKIVVTGGTYGAPISDRNYVISTGPLPGLHLVSSNNYAGDGGTILLGGSSGPAGYIRSFATNNNAGQVIIGNRRVSNEDTMYAGIVLDTNGNVGIGVTSPTYKLDVAGDLRITGIPYRAAGDIVWTVPSDARLKDIKSDYTLGLKEIIALNPVRYTDKENEEMQLHSDKEYIGIIAQEALKVIPESVSTDKSGYLSLNTTPIFWSLINAIKELAKSDDDLKDRIEQQQEQIDLLEARLEVLENK